MSSEEQDTFTGLDFYNTIVLMKMKKSPLGEDEFKKGVMDTIKISRSTDPAAVYLSQSATRCLNELVDKNVLSKDILDKWTKDYDEEHPK